MMKRPSDVPPVQLISGLTPVTFSIAPESVFTSFRAG